jgi:hypothetical protein
VNLFVRQSHCEVVEHFGSDTDTQMRDLTSQRCLGGVTSWDEATILNDKPATPREI